MTRSVSAASVRAGSLLLCALVLASACGQTVRVRAPPGSSLALGDEEPVPVPQSGTAEVRVPIGYLDPGFELSDEDGTVVRDGRLPRDDLSGWWAAPIVGTTLCAAMPLSLCGFCIANPELIAVAPLACLSPQLAVASSNTLSTTLDSPSWMTVPTMILCAGSAGACLALLPFTLRVTDEINLLDEDSPLPEPSGEAMLW